MAGRVQGAICRAAVPCRIAFRNATLRQAGGDDNQESRSPGASLFDADARRGGSAADGVGLGADQPAGSYADAKPGSCSRTRAFQLATEWRVGGASSGPLATGRAACRPYPACADACSSARPQAGCTDTDSDTAGTARSGRDADTARAAGTDSSADPDTDARADTSTDAATDSDAEDTGRSATGTTGTRTTSTRTSTGTG